MAVYAYYVYGVMAVVLVAFSPVLWFQARPFMRFSLVLVCGCGVVRDVCSVCFPFGVRLGLLWSEFPNCSVLKVFVGFAMFLARMILHAS